MLKKLLTLLLLFVTVDAAQAASTDTLVVRIKGMRCEECAHKVGEVLKPQAGINSLDFNLERRTVAIAYDPAAITTDTIKAILKKTGRYQSSVYDPKEVIRKPMGLKVEEMQSMDDLIAIMNRLYKVEGMDSVIPHLDNRWIFVRYDANRTNRATIISFLVKNGYTPVAYYTDKRISQAYIKMDGYNWDEEKTESILGIDGVEDVCYNPYQKTLAITYLNTETTEEKLLTEIKAEGGR